MKFRYIGDKQEMEVFGYDFSGGRTPDVKDETAIRKLTGNSHFEAVEDPAEKAAAEKAAAEKAAAEKAAAEKAAAEKAAAEKAAAEKAAAEKAAAEKK